MSKAAQERLPPKDDLELIRRAAELQQQRVKETNTRIAGLLNGEIKAPNEIVEYLVRQLRNNKRDHDQLQQQVQQVSTQLQALQTRMAGLEGEYNSRIADLQHWDRELVVLPAKDPVPENPLGEPELKVVPDSPPAP
jgi:septal ring factor EnvC (AmiA/AmiB activator)